MHRLWIAAEPDAQIHASRFAEVLHLLSGLSVERIKPVLVAKKDAPLPARFPVGDSTTAPSTGPLPLIRIEAPTLFSGRRVERKHTQLWRGRIEDPVYDHWIALHIRAVERILRVVAPGHGEPADVFTIDLLQRRIVDIVRTAAVSRPASIQVP